MLYRTIWKGVGGAAAHLWAWAGAHQLALALILGMVAFAWRMRSLAQAAVTEQGRERRMREELEAYLTLDLSPLQDCDTGGPAVESTLARRVCSTVAEKSAFSRVSLLLRNPEGRLVVTGSIGTDDLTVAALQAWGEGVMEDERSGRSSGLSTSDAGTQSFSIPLGEWHRFDPEIASWAQSGRRERRRWRRGMITPVRTRGGRMLGALAVCADGTRLDGAPIGNAGEAWNSGRPASVERALSPLEALAARLAAAMEANTLAERLLRAEKLAGLGQLANGVAHALNNPLTAILGFADLIAETTTEAHVRKDAGIILSEATRMKGTVQRLVEFSQPPRLPDRTLDLSALLNEVATACRSGLATRQIKLELKGLDAPGPLLVGSSDRLRDLLEHLLNNAAQAVASFQGSSGSEDEVPTIRIALLHDDRITRVIISDSGPGFAEPARAFDPFYTTRGPEQGAGLGLSICYGIVREHGGEIHAFNLHPHGASVVLEFPARRAARIEDVLTGEEEAMPLASQ